MRALKEAQLSPEATMVFAEEVRESTRRADILGMDSLGCEVQPCFCMESVPLESLEAVLN